MSERVLITGANRGIGLALAQAYAAAGHSVIATARTPAHADALHALAAAHDGRVSTIALDADAPASIEAAAAQVRAQHGALDVLVNNAAILPEPDSFATFDVDTALRVFRTNVAGPVLVARAFLPLLQAGHTPRLVNVSSGAGSVSTREHVYAPTYSASKAALNMLTRTLAHDRSARGVIVVVVDPGWVRTDMGGPNANLAPEDSAAGLLTTIARLTPTDTGTFWRYDGQRAAW